MNYEIPKIENKTIYETLRLCNVNDMDICDDDWDWGICVQCEDNFEQCHDYYDKFMLLFCLNVVCLKFNREWYSPCKVCDFIEQNRKAFDKFLNEENRESCRPMDFTSKLCCDEDNGYYEIYMQSLEQLIAGQYSERQYEKLYKYLGGK